MEEGMKFKKMFETVFRIFTGCVRLLIELINSRTWNISIIHGRSLSNPNDNVIIASNLSLPVLLIFRICLSTNFMKFLSMSMSL